MDYFSPFKKGKVFFCLEMKVGICIDDAGALFFDCCLCMSVWRGTESWYCLSRLLCLENLNRMFGWDARKKDPIWLGFHHLPINRKRASQPPIAQIVFKSKLDKTQSCGLFVEQIFCWNKEQVPKAACSTIVNLFH